MEGLRAKYLNELVGKGGVGCVTRFQLRFIACQFFDASKKKVFFSKSSQQFFFPEFLRKQNGRKNGIGTAKISPHSLIQQ